MLPENKIICGGALEVLKTLPKESISCCISSPPYWALRDYGVNGQLGLEKTFEEYIDKLCTIYDEVKRVLRKDGTCFVNLGDTYWGGKGQSGRCDHNLEERVRNGRCMQRREYTLPTKHCPQDGKHDTVQAKSLCLIPQRFAISMVERGWILRNVIVWHKPNPMPSSAKDRFTVDFEYVYFFVKSKKYWFEPQYEPHSLDTQKRESVEGRLKNNAAKDVPFVKGFDKVYLNPLGRNKRCVWTIPTQPFSEWAKTYRLVRAEQDGTCDGRIHIASPNCQEHGGLFDLWTMLFGDVRGDDVLSRISHIYDYLCQVQPADFVPTVTPHVYYCGRYNWDYLLRQCFPSATDRNSESHKKAHALLTNPSYRLYAQRLDRIVHILVSHGLSETSRGIYESNTWPVDLDARLLGEMFFRIVDKPSFQKLLNNNNCKCGLYHIKTEKTSHFATFPEKLVEPMIKAGCPEFICTKCGKAREKVWDIKTMRSTDKWSQVDRIGERGAGGGHNIGIMGGPALAKFREENPPKFIGYTDCGCGAEFVPGVVWDPFVGSGTTLQVAARLNRNYGGSEIKQEYIEMAERRIMVGETGISVKEQNQGQQALFK
jgi:site-specific DNA-methyltransferase (adenine-specific)